MHKSQNGGRTFRRRVDCIEAIVSTSCRSFVEVSLLLPILIII